MLDNAVLFDAPLSIGFLTMLAPLFYLTHHWAWVSWRCWHHCFIWRTTERGFPDDVGTIVLFDAPLSVGFLTMLASLFYLTHHWAWVSWRCWHHCFIWRTTERGFPDDVGTIVLFDAPLSMGFLTMLAPLFYLTYHWAWVSWRCWHHCFIWRTTERGFPDDRCWHHCFIWRTTERGFPNDVGTIV